METNTHISQTKGTGMSYHSSSISSLGRTPLILALHTHKHVDRTYVSYPDTFSLSLCLSYSHTHKHTHTFLCLRTQSVLHCLFMKSSVCCRQAGDEDIHSVSWFGHIFNIINLLSNLPWALATCSVVSRDTSWNCLRFTSNHLYQKQPSKFSGDFFVIWLFQYTL